MAEYIEREALIAELCKGTIITDDLYGMGIMAGVDAAMKKIKSLHAADVAPVRHARWGEPYLIFDDIVARDCPVCNYTIGEMKTNYCPNCGAKMDLEVSV